MRERVKKQFWLDFKLLYAQAANLIIIKKNKQYERFLSRQCFYERENNVDINAVHACLAQV